MRKDNNAVPVIPDVNVQGAVFPLLGLAVAVSKSTFTV